MAAISLRLLAGRWKTVTLLAAGLVVGLLLGGGGDAPSQAGHTHAEAEAETQWYTCSMHPQVRLKDPNARCPICGMELIPVTSDSGGAGDGPRTLSMSEDAKRLAEVRTTRVARRIVTKQVRLVGKVGYDETSLSTITAWVPGRLDKLYVDYTGVAVRKGAPMVYMYSPELLVAQDSLLKADRAYAEMKRTSASARNLEMQAGTVQASVERLKLWGLTDAQVASIRKRGTASDHMTILSPIPGIVIRKRAVEGDYVKVGTKIYEIADLSRVWVYLDAYESDLAWIRYAQEVEFEAEAYPGEVFQGRISFVDPFLDQTTRTVRVRVTVENVDGRLKPGMFVRARIHAKLAEGGRIVEPTLAGKWISPVHPEVVRDKPGNCPICNTPLVSAESLGYVSPSARAPLVIPATAPLRTGKRAVVYVAVPGAERPTYSGREIVLGPRTEEHYIVVSGLKEGEEVVSNGVFKIDSALQILAKRSMMSPDAEEEGEAPRPVAAPSFVASLTPLYEAAARTQKALAADDLDRARKAMGAAEGAVDAADMSHLAGKGHTTWMRLRVHLLEHARTGAEAADLDAARVAFAGLSEAVLKTVRAFGQATGKALYAAHCPMAFSHRGASWLAFEKEIRNPFLGSKMPGCGDVTATFPSAAGKATIPEEFRQDIAHVVGSYLDLQKALAGDDLKGSIAAAGALEDLLVALRATGLDPVALESWRKSAGALHDATATLRKATDLEAARRPFALLSDTLAAVLRRFGPLGPADLVVAHCPMAFAGRGADWVQRGDTLHNPYFGAAMPRCGAVTHRIAAKDGN